MSASKKNSRTRDDGTFRWLHFGNWLAEDDTTGRTDAARWCALLDDLEELRQDCGPWDAVFITGEIVRDASLAASYQRATEEIESLLESLRASGSDPVILTVPGECDLWSKAVPRIGLHELMTDVEAVRRRLQVPEKSSRLKVAINAFFSRYRDWSETLPRPMRYREGPLPGDFAATIQFGPHRIGVAGLNAAFTSAVAFESAFAVPTLNPYQLDAACEGDPDGWAESHDVCLLLTAYAPWRLDPEVASAFHSEIAPPGRFALQLCGPGGPGYKLTCVQDGPTLVVKAPPFLRYTRGKAAEGYIAGAIRLEPGPEPVTLRPRRYDSSRSEFIDEPEFVPEALETFRRSVARTESPPRSLPAPSPAPAVSMRSSSRRAPTAAASPASRLRVRYLEVQNFRCLDHLRIDFAQPGSLPGQWTCLAGINGAGKSSILQALALGLLGEPLVRELGGDRLGRMQRLQNDRRKEARVRLWLEEGEQRHYVELTLGGDDFETRWGRPGPPKALTAFWKSMRQRVVVAYGSTRNLSDFVDTRYISLSSDVRRIMTLFDPLCQVSSAEYLLNKRSLENSPLPQLFRAIVKQVFDKDLGVHPRGGKLQFSAGGEPVEAVDLPDGFRSSIAWLVDLCDVWCQKTGPHKRPPRPEDVEAIVLIDEIDLHLHPSLQRALVPRLRKALPNVQWIVSTHSPLILSSFETSELIALDRDEPGGVRVLDRQILGFTTDQVYNWLMGTPATSAALEESLSGASNEADEEKLAQLLQMSPQVDARQAAHRASLRKERLKRLKQ
jgi:hypothetical protein